MQVNPTRDKPNTEQTYLAHKYKMQMQSCREAGRSIRTPDAGVIDSQLTAESQ